MPNDTPRPRASLSRLRRSRPSEARQAHAAPSPRALRDPRARATLTYALPLAPALYLLARERRARFVRLHAAQALIFFAGIGLAQALLFALAVVLGNVAAGSWAELPVGLLLWGALLALGAGAFMLWLRLLAEAWNGRLRRRRVLSPLATRLERLAASFTRAVSSAGEASRNIPHDACADAAPRSPGQED